jgi:anaerobic selenocysteine-containing dehydrogenase
VEIRPDDAAALGVRDGDLVQVSSRRGTIRLPARLSADAMPGTVFLPFHWGDQFAPGQRRQLPDGQRDGPAVAPAGVEVLCGRRGAAVMNLRDFRRAGHLPI